MAYFAASCDDVDTNTRFAESLDLDYAILSDPSCDTARAFGVARGESKYPARHTFYIGSDGKVLKVDRQVRPGTAGPDVAAHLRELGVATTGGE